MKLLPILWVKPPTADDWRLLSEAREAIGYTEKVKPAQALQGSPGRILAVGTMPDWLCEFNYVTDTQDSRLADVLAWCLNPELEDIWAPTPEDMIVKWSGGEFVYVGEEAIDEQA